MPDIRMPDGTIVRNVPEGTTQSQLLERFQRFQAQQPVQPEIQPTDGLQPEQQEILRRRAEEITPTEAGLLGVGRGIVGLGRGLGLVGPETPTERQVFEAIEERRPIAVEAGEIIGEAAPFAAIGGPIVGIGRGLISRSLLSAGVGAVEGGILASSEEESVGFGVATGATIAGSIEAVSPVIGKLAGGLFRRIKGRLPKKPLIDKFGKPSDELKSALDEAGLGIDDLSDQAQQLLIEEGGGFTPTEAVRRAQFKELGIEPTTGDITQQFTQQAEEARLVTSASEAAANPLRTRRLEQSQALRQRLNEIVDNIDAPQNVGDAVKDALIGRKELLTSQKNKLYKEAAKTAENLGGLPILTDNIRDAIPDAAELRRLSRFEGSQVPALRDLLVEFGIDKTPASVDAFTRAGGEVLPLSLDNVEEFRQSLNRVIRADRTGAGAVAVSPIKNALDDEMELIGKSLDAAGITDQNIINTLADARSTVQQIKTEFSPADIRGQLIGLRKDGFTPIIESSQVFDKIVKGNRPPELIEKTIESLKKAEGGGSAIASIQSATVLDLLNSAFAAESRKISGEKVFGGNAFNKQLNKLGERKLKAIFSTRPQLLKRLELVGRIAKDIEPSSAATPKGSGPILLDMLNKTQALSVADVSGTSSTVIQAIRLFLKEGGDSVAVNRALQGKPVLREALNQAQRRYPSIFSAIATSVAIEET